MNTVKNTEQVSTTTLDAIAFLYLLIPCILFIFGWFDIWISVPIILILTIILLKLFSRSRNAQLLTSFKKSYKELIPGLAIFFIYIFLTGITWNWKQHVDFFVRNDIFYDLVYNSWPPKFPDGRYFLYYFQSWLPAALVGKLFGWTAALWANFAWFCIGITLAIIYVYRFLGIVSFGVAFIIMTWNGLELVPCSLIAPWSIDKTFTEAFALNDHVAGDYNYITETVSYSMKNICHVFVPISLICGMLLHDNIRKVYTPLLGTLALMYSPMSSMALLPILTYLYFKDFFYSPKELMIKHNWCKLLKSLTQSQNVSAYVLCFFILSYYALSNNVSQFHPENFLSLKATSFFCFYLFFNIGIAGLLIRMFYRDNLLWIVLGTHIIIIATGLVYHCDVAMKGSVVTSFYIAILFSRSFLNAPKSRIIWYILYLVFASVCFIHMTGALAATIIGSILWIFFKYRFKVQMLICTVFCLLLTFLLPDKYLLSIKGNLQGKSVRIHNPIGIYQKDGGSGPWWWYRTFPHVNNIPPWFKK